MKKTILLGLFICSSYLTNAQNTISNNSDLEQEIIKNESGGYKISEKNSEGNVIIKGTLQNNSPQVKNGEFTFYDSDGNITCNGTYQENVPSGTWLYFNSEGDTIQSLDYESAIDFFTTQKLDESESAFFMVDIMPKFQGGNINTFTEYVMKNIKYPIYAQLKGYTGRVFIQLVVDKQGEIKNIKVLRGTESLDLNMEAIRVISESPKWEPGTQRTKKMNVSFTVPINFQLETE